MKINLSHGNGATETAGLIDSVFMKHFKNKWSEQMEDSALLEFPQGAEKRLAFTTDSFVVKPLFFLGGDIGRLAVCGTVNDLLTSGAKPLYLSASFIIEEGTDTEVLEKIACSMQKTAEEAGVCIVTGDTKVIDGNGGVYINTSGIGLVENAVRFAHSKEGDRIIVTGNLGDHHACILSSRLNIQNSIATDAAPLTKIVEALKNENIPLHGMRDITRGGLATVLNEVASSINMQIQIDETELPIGESVKGLCGILGLDPLYMGNEGNMLILVPKEFEEQALSIIRKEQYGEYAKAIGYLATGSGVVLKTKIGGRRIVSSLTGEGLPRIC